MVYGITFDLEGTVIDLESAHWQGHLLAAKEAGLNLELDRAMREIPCFVGGPDERIAETIAELCGRKVDAAVLLERSKYHFQRLLASGHKIEPRPGFLGVLKIILERGIPVAIGSLTERSLAIKLISESGLGSYLRTDRIVLKEDVAKLKPAPDVYIRTAELLGVEPEQQLVFEDSINGIKAAHLAGSKVIAMPTVQSSDFTRQLVLAGALSVFRSWDEVNIAAILVNLNNP
jgi:beta-phosphoglucomutase